MNLSTILKKKAEEITEQEALALLDFIHENRKTEKVREGIKHNLIFGATEKEETDFKTLVNLLYNWSLSIYNTENKQTLSKEFIQKFIQEYSNDLEGFYHEYSKIAKSSDSKYSKFLYNYDFNNIRKKIVRCVRYNERKEYIPIIQEVHSKLDTNSYSKLTEDEILNICHLISVYHNNLGKESIDYFFSDQEIQIMSDFENLVLEWTNEQQKKRKILSENFIDEIEKMRFPYDCKFLTYKSTYKTNNKAINIRENEYDYDKFRRYLNNSKTVMNENKTKEYLNANLKNMNENKILEMIEEIYQNLQTLDKLHEKHEENEKETKEENFIYEKNVDNCYLEMNRRNKAIYEWNTQIEKDALITQMVIESDNKVKYFSDDFISKFEEVTDKILKDYKYKYSVTPTVDIGYAEKRDVGTIESLGHIARRISDQQEASDLLYVSKMKDDEFLEMIEKTYVFLLENKQNSDDEFYNKGKTLLFLLQNYFKNTREKTTEAKDFYYSKVEGKTEISEDFIKKLNKIVNKYNKENSFYFKCHFYRSLNELAENINNLAKEQQTKENS